MDVLFIYLMQSPDIQRSKHIRDYCLEVEKPLQDMAMIFPSLTRIRKETANRMPCGPIKGVRNLVAHNYGSMSRDIIWETRTMDIPAWNVFCEAQLALVK